MTSPLWPAACVRRPAATARGSFAHQRRLSEEALDEIDGENGSLVVLVERGIELDDIERSDPPRVRDHFHAELRLAVVRSARHRRADAGRDAGIEEIDVEADVEMR